MAATYVCSFGFPGVSLGTSPAWLWEDADDSAFCAFVQERAGVYIGDVTVDRSGAAPVLRWQVYQYQYPPGVYQPSGQYGSLTLSVGTFISAPSGIPAVLDMAGRWESDQFGRPYNLNDLLAEQ